MLEPEGESVLTMKTPPNTPTEPKYIPSALFLETFHHFAQKRHGAVPRDKLPSSPASSEATVDNSDRAADYAFYAAGGDEAYCSDSNTGPFSAALPTTQEPLSTRGNRNQTQGQPNENRNAQEDSAANEEGDAADKTVPDADEEVAVAVATPGGRGG